MEGVRPYSEEQYREFRKWWLDTTVGEAFNKTCDAHPEREALVEGEQRLTFSQVREEVQKAALAFLKLGLGKETPVLFHLPNCIEAVYSYLALTAIGAVPILVLSRQGQRELEHFCSLTGAVAWIGPARYGKMEYIPIVKGLRDKCASMQYIIVVRDEAPPGTISFSGMMEEAELTGETASYLGGFSPSPDDILHLSPTGGTTGLSKLVPKTHNSHLIKSYSFTRHLEFGFGEVMLPVGPLSHDGPHLFSLCSWVLFGGRLVLYPSTKPKDLLGQIEKERVTYFFVIPTLLTDILEEPDLDKYDISSLSAIMLGGARVSEEFVRSVIDRLNVSVHPGYGATEGPGTFPRRYDPIEIVATTYGRGLCPYDRYRVVDEDGNDVTQGQEGEILFWGPGMFTGYYKSEEEDKFVFSPDGFFCTGDIGRFDPQGNITITGRKKDIIRRAAESISAPEIEALVIRHPNVSWAAAVGMPDPRLGERICVYVQPVPGKTVSLEEIVSYLKTQGASVMFLPERLEVMKELPLTAMDKVDKKILRQDIARKLEAEGRI